VGGTVDPWSGLRWGTEKAGAQCAGEE